MARAETAGVGIETEERENEGLGTAGGARDGNETGDPDATGAGVGSWVGAVAGVRVGNEEVETDLTRAGGADEVRGGAEEEALAGTGGGAEAGREAVAGKGADLLIGAPPANLPTPYKHQYGSK